MKNQALVAEFESVLRLAQQQLLVSRRNILGRSRKPLLVKARRQIIRSLLKRGWHVATIAPMLRRDVSTIIHHRDALDLVTITIERKYLDRLHHTGEVPLHLLNVIATVLETP